MPSENTTYEILVKGHLDHRWTVWFTGFSISNSIDQEDNPVTRISGPVSDQAELHGILAKLRDIGIPILSFNSYDNRKGGEK